MTHTQAKLIVIEGPQDPGPFFLAPDAARATLGSDAGASAIVLPGEGVAGAHCELRLEADRWWLAPLAGAEVLVDGEPAREPRVVEDVTTLQIGPYRLQFLLEEVDAPLPRVGRRPAPRTVTLQAAPPPPPAPATDEAEEALSALSAALKTDSFGRKLCRCGQALSPRGTGYTCPTCQRTYDRKGRPLVPTRRAAPRGSAFSRLLRSGAAWLVLGGAALAVAGVGLVIYLHAGTDKPGPSDKDAPPVLLLEQALPPQAGKLLDVIVRMGVLRQVMAAEDRPDRVKLAEGQTLTVKVDQTPYPLRVARAWEGTLRWEADVPKLANDVAGLAVEVRADLPVGAKTLAPGTLLVRGTDRWHTARRAGK